MIIGGGIIGASCASELSRAGMKVTLIEKGRVGYGCSYGNAGWMTPCFAMPLPMPGLFFKSLTWLLDPEGPLYIKPTPSLFLMKWLLKFLSSMNEAQAGRAIEALVELSKISLQEYERLNKALPGKMGLDKKGLLMVASTPSGLKACVNEMNLVSEHGVPGRQLSAEDVRKFEPAIRREVLGGVYFPEEAHAEPLATVRTLIDEAKLHGAEILEDTEVLSFEVFSNKVQAIHTTRGRMHTDMVVLATGSWSREIGKLLELRVPMLGGKGYSMIVPKLDRQPEHPIMWIEKKIAITPRENSLRMAGTLELVDQDFAISPRRVKAIMKGCRDLLYLPDDVRVMELWRGLRPCTPDGVPMIGWSKKINNLMLACGHQMLGLQSGSGTGKLVGDLILGRALNLRTDVFNPERF